MPTSGFRLCRFIIPVLCLLHITADIPAAQNTIITPVDELSTASAQNAEIILTPSDGDYTAHVTVKTFKNTPVAGAAYTLQSFNRQSGIQNVMKGHLDSMGKATLAGLPSGDRGPTLWGNSS